MDILQEFLDPVPLSVLALIVFGIIMFWLISKCFRLPDDFALGEAVREEIRFRLFDKEMTAKEELRKKEEAKARMAEEEAAENAAKGENSAASGATPENV